MAIFVLVILSFPVSFVQYIQSQRYENATRLSNSNNPGVRSQESLVHFFYSRSLFTQNNLPGKHLTIRGRWGHQKGAYIFPAFTSEKLQLRRVQDRYRHVFKQNLKFL